MKSVQQNFNDKNELGAILSARDFVEINSYLKYRLVCVLCPVLFKILEIPPKGIIFINILMQYRGYNYDSTIDLKDEDLVNKRKKIERSTIKSHRRELKEYMTRNKINVLDISYRNPAKELGTIYGLNFIKTLENAIRDFSQDKVVSIKSLIEMISYFEKYEESVFENRNNNLVNELIDHVKNQAESLKNKNPVINETSQILMNKYY